jgi:transposase-like protein
MEGEVRTPLTLYLRFTLSFLDVRDLPAERSPEVSDESVRRWVLTFGPAIARNGMTFGDIALFGF